LFTRFEQYDESMGLLSETVNSGVCDDATVEAAGLAAVRMPLLPSEIPPDRRKMIRLAGSGFCALQLGQRDDAEKLFSQMVTAYPNEPGAHFLFGTFLMTARPEDGIRELRRELEISPFHVPARLRLAEGYLRDEKIDQALPLAGEAVKIDPGDASAHMVYGEALAAKKDLSGAIRELEMARGQAPQMVRVHWDLVRTYTAAGRAAEANREKEEIEKLNHAGGGE
jgi:tetratricopeptide (TPR) repeat protein